MYCAGLTGPLMSYADLEMFDFSENIAKDGMIKNLAKHQFSVIVIVFWSQGRIKTSALSLVTDM